jgi:hypothetical protein
MVALGISFARHGDLGPPPELVYGAGVVWVLLAIITIAGFWAQRRLRSLSTASIAKSEPG